VFLFPGALLLVLGLAVHLALLLGMVRWNGRPAAAVTGVFGTIFSVVGFQILSLGLHAKTYSWSRRFDRHNRSLERFYRHFTLESGLALGAALALLGGIVLGTLIVQWLRSDLLPLPHPEWASLGATLFIIGCSTLFSSLFISAMSVSRPNDGP
jgi:hypothetical protein